MRRRSSRDPGHLSDPGVLILSSLAGGPKHGYALMQDIATFTGTRLEPGTLYRLTSDGAAALRSQLDTMAGVVAVGMRRLSRAGDA